MPEAAMYLQSEGEPSAYRCTCYSNNEDQRLGYTADAERRGHNVVNKIGRSV